MSNLTAPLQVALRTDGEDAKRADLPAIRQEFEAQVAELKATAESLTVTDATQLTEMKLARATRLSLRDIRLHVESRHKELKADVLKRGLELDAFKRQLLAVIEPLEVRLLEQEQFAERAEKARQDALDPERRAKLAEYDDQPLIGINLGAMPQAMWKARLAAERKAAQAPDRAKLEALLNALARVPFPVMTTEAGRVSLGEIDTALQGVLALIQRRMEAM